MSEQENIFHAMTRPDFYPHPTASVIERETHISRVFLTGGIVYKVKKAVDFGFLDFSTLEKRRFYCLREVELNRRLAPKVYLDVVPISRRDGGYLIEDGEDQAVEYAVKMRQLPDHRSMRYLLKTSGVDGKSIDGLAKVLAGFYRTAETGDTIRHYGSWKEIRKNCIENFKMTETYAGQIFDERRFRIVQAATCAFLQRRKPLMLHRAEQGKIRDCHGDLRSDHIYFTDDGIQIIDCVEFSDRFRYQDITCDLAFLMMDLDHEGFPNMGAKLLESYVSHSGDRDVFVLLDFYKCYRAMVRCKVNCFRLAEKHLGTGERNRLLEETGEYLDLAYQYAERFTRPTLWIICGMPASGKSTISSELSRILEIPCFRSDVIRKEIFRVQTGHSADAPFESGIYAPSATSLTYGKLLLAAQEELKKGNSVILDATFSSSRRRAEALRLAGDTDSNILFVECVPSDETLKERLAERENSGSVSDARLRHFSEFKKRFEPPEEIRREFRIPIDTGELPEACMRQIFSREYLPPADIFPKA